MASNKLTPTEAKFIARAERGADDMRDMITTLLDVGRLEAGQMPLRLEAHDIALIAREATARFSPVLGGRALLYDVPPEPIVISCDADVIRRVLDNLISNALKFTRSDGTIRLSVQCTVTDVCISVSTMAQGIPADQQEHILRNSDRPPRGAKQRHPLDSASLLPLPLKRTKEKSAFKANSEKEARSGSTLPVRDKAVTSIDAFARSRP